MNKEGKHGNDKTYQRKHYHENLRLEIPYHNYLVLMVSKANMINNLEFKED